MVDPSLIQYVSKEVLALPTDLYQDSTCNFKDKGTFNFCYRGVSLASEWGSDEKTTRQDENDTQLLFKDSWAGRENLR